MDKNPRVLIIGSRHDQAGEDQNLLNYKKYFQDLLGGEYTVSSALLDDLVFDVSPDQFSILDTENRSELSDYKLIIVRGKLRDDLDMLFGLSVYCKSEGVKFFNDYSNNRPTSKLAQAINFHIEKIPFPRTIYAAPGKLMELIDKADFTFPFIYKSTFGSHGNDNYLIKDQEHLKEVAKPGMLTQEFVPNDYDYRILVAGDNHTVIKRSSGGQSHLNNTSQGGQAELITDFPAEIINQCHELAKKMGMELAGVDVIIGKNDGNPYFLEINSQPQVMTGAFLDIKKQVVKKALLDLLDS